MTRKVGVEDVVVYHDEYGKPHESLVTAVWSQTCINLVHVQSNEKMKDNYGRQLERESSVQHGSIVDAHGNYWRFPEEEPNPYKAPEAV